MIVRRADVWHLCIRVNPGQSKRDAEVADKAPHCAGCNSGTTEAL